MAFVALASDAGAAPTFFELVAADRLMPSLKAAAAYTLSVSLGVGGWGGGGGLRRREEKGESGDVAAFSHTTPCPPLPAQVFAQRRPSLHRFLAYEDELFALLSLALERGALARHSASFADTLYGLRRAPLPPSGGSPSRRPLTRREQRRTLAFLVLAPYARSKLDALYTRSTRPGPGGARVPLAHAAPVDAAPPTRAQRAVDAATAALVRAYPTIIGVIEGLRFVYQTAYLLDGGVGSVRGGGGSSAGRSSPPPTTPRFFGPSHALLRQAVVRVSGPELADADARTWAARRATLTSRGPLGRATARAAWAASDHGRSALILAVFGFKALEWWYTTGETALGGRKPLPPPPPPPAPPPARGGVPLPADPSLCPLCATPTTNPAMAVPSGYVFCYPCLYGHVSTHGACPVTRLPCGVEGVRRLYQSS